MNLNTNSTTARIIFAAPRGRPTVPALPIARALIERGNTVRWYAGRKYADGSEPSARSTCP